MRGMGYILSKIHSLQAALLFRATWWCQYNFECHWAPCQSEERSIRCELWGKGIKGDSSNWKDLVAVCWDAEGHGGKQVWRDTVESSAVQKTEIPVRHPGRDGLKVVNCQSLGFMGAIWARERNIWCHQYRLNIKPWVWGRSLRLRMVKRRPWAL